MNVALMNVRITLQRNTTAVDDIGNHLAQWEDYYSCSATVSGESGAESVQAGTTVDSTTIDFTVRYCRASKEVNPTEFRILFNGEIYNILSIDHMNYKRKALKFRCQTARR